MAVVGDIADPLPRMASKKIVQMNDFYGLRVGDQVCVHGHGFGKIVDMRKSHWPSSDLVTVEIPREEVHKPSGQTIYWTETHQTHPRHVSLNSRVAQERAAARKDKEPK